MIDLFNNPSWFELFCGSFLIGLSGSVSPGPVLIRTIVQTPRHGALTGTYMMAGHAALELILLVGLTLGLGALLTLNWVFILIAGGGGLLLLWMSVMMFRELPQLTLAADEDVHAGSVSMPPGTRHSPDSHWELVRDGILTSLANPYWILWWATIGLSLMAVALRFGWGGLTVFYLGHISSDILWYTFVSMVITFGKHWLSDRIYRGIVGVCAVFLGLFGLMFLVDAIQRSL
jgi:threonine/homoserine/homoserine lactone efflux protein